MAERKERTQLEPEGSIRVGSVRTFLTEMERFEPENGYTYFFRGHSRFSHQLLPSIYRDPGWIANEDVLFKELVLRCPNDFSGQESTFQALVKMQHYSLPTRLLDITANPLVALYFACEYESQPRESGEVVVFRIPTAEIKYFDSDTVSVLANISRRPQTFKLPDAGLDREAFNDHPEIHYLLHEVKREKPYFEPLILRAHLESVLFVKPKLDNARVIKQDGAFLLFGIDGGKTRPAAVPLGYLAAAAHRRLLVEPSKKAFIRKQLESFGLTQATIFPEIDKVAEFIKNNYATLSHAQNLKDARRPRMNFHELGVPTGSVLLFKDGQSQAVVVSDKKVELQGAVCSLTAATRKLLGLPDDYPLQPSPHWSFNGQSLKALYEAVHDGGE